MAKPAKMSPEERERQEENQRRFRELLDKRLALDEKLRREREQREAQSG
jgi:hypothetical protein